MKALFKRIVTKILRQAKKMALTDGVIARSMALGMVVGFSPTVGLQMVICLLIIIPINRIAGRYLFDMVVAVVGSLVVNPLTMVPTYTLYYFIGCRAIACSAMMEFQSEDQVHQVLGTLGSGAFAIFIGSIPFMLVGWPVGYWIGRQIEHFLERRVALRKSRLVALARERRRVGSEVATENG